MKAELFFGNELLSQQNRLWIFWQISKQGKMENKQFKYVVLHVHKLDKKHIARYVVNKVFTSYQFVRQRWKNVTVISMRLGDILTLRSFLSYSYCMILIGDIVTFKPLMKLINAPFKLTFKLYHSSLHTRAGSKKTKLRQKQWTFEFWRDFLTNKFVKNLHFFPLTKRKNFCILHLRKTICFVYKRMFILTQKKCVH